MPSVSGLSTVDVAVDAMGGDHAPAVPVEAGVRAARRGIRVALVGDPVAIQPHLDRLKVRRLSTLRVQPATETIAMDEKPSRAVRTKRDASVCVAARLVASGDARAMVSAGNSGAAMAAALLDIGRIAGVQRPAIAASLPTRRGSKVVLLDLGASVDPTPVQLAQSASMGVAYARAVLGIARPRIALLANGSEEQKGNALTRAAHELVEPLGYDYSGYCEGRDVFEGELDVVVTDGFTGNVLLKTLEGFVATVRDLIERQARGRVLAGASALIVRDVARRLGAKLDWEASGAAPLLGVRRRCLVAHGASTVEAMTNAIRTADGFASTRIVEAIADEMRRGAELGLWPLSRPSDAALPPLGPDAEPPAD